MKLFFSLFLTLVVMTAQAQDINVLLKEADNLEKQQKEAEALAKYKLILGLEPSHLRALVKAAELNVNISRLQVDKGNRRLYIETAYSYAKRALFADSNSADAN